MTTIAEAVGSDITNVVRSCVESEKFGAAAHLFATYLSNEYCVAVSEYTREIIIAAAAEIDAHHGTQFAAAVRRTDRDLVPGDRLRPVRRASTIERSSRPRYAAAWNATGTCCSSRVCRRRRASTT